MYNEREKKPMPHFYKGYDKDLDLTEDEYLNKLLSDSYDEDPEPEPTPPASTFEVWASTAELEGEPYEDTYFPGIPDYDIFNRPSWGTDEEE